MADYNLKLIQKKLTEIGIEKDDTIYCHSNIGFFGLPEQEISDNLPKVFFDCLQEKVGENGTLIFPTFTYSFSQNRNNTFFSKNDYGKNVVKNNVFDLKNSKSNMGLLSEYARLIPNSTRTADPFFSSVIIGKLNNYLSKNISNNSFGQNSLFERLHKINAKVLTFNFPGTTFIHYVERELSVEYRYDKEFWGEIVTNKDKEKIKWVITVNDLSKSSYTHNPFPYVKYIKQNNVAKFTQLGRGEMLVISCEEIFNIIKENLSLNKWFLTKKYEE